MHAVAGTDALQLIEVGAASRQRRVPGDACIDELLAVGAVQDGPAAERLHRRLRFFVEAPVIAATEGIGRGQHAQRRLHPGQLAVDHQGRGARGLPHRGQRGFPVTLLELAERNGGQDHDRRKRRHHQQGEMHT